jgi:hypothetical protein
MMNETTWGDIHDVYMAAEDVMDRHNLKVVTDVEAGADDWVRMIDVAGVITQLEAENDALKRGIGFFASVIKSGEKWTQYCQDMYDALTAEEQGERPHLATRDGMNPVERLLADAEEQE